MKIKAYIELTKPSIMQMVIVTYALGYFVGAESFSPLSLFSLGMFTSILVCSGVSVLNQVMEIEFDALMDRTKNRPLPTKLISKTAALVFGLSLVLCGIGLMYVYISPMFALLGGITAITYVLMYTPMKRISWLNTTIGSVPGALPPLGGYLIGKGVIDETGWLLFAVLFFWQHSHFYAIAWLCRVDYAKAGFKMITLGDEEGKNTFRHAFVHSIFLLASCIGLYYTSNAGLGYLITSGLLSVWFVYRCYEAMTKRTDKTAKRVLLDSLIYLVIFTVSICVDLSL
jgi:protoheme IX farnesyltransferase